jgi:hypothetical protein
MTTTPCIKIGFIEREIEVVRSGKAFAEEETPPTIYGTVDVPIGRQCFPVSEHLCQTRDGREWFQKYQAYHRVLYRGDLDAGDLIPQALYVSVKTLPFRRLRYFAKPVSWFKIQPPFIREEDQESRARITSLDEKLAALVDVTFAKTNTGEKADMIGFSSTTYFVRDAEDNIYTYKADDVKKESKQRSILGRVLHENLKHGLHFFDWLSGVMEHNPVFKLNPPLDHWIEQAHIPYASTSFKNKTAPVVRLTFVPPKPH